MEKLLAQPSSAIQTECKLTPDTKASPPFLNKSNGSNAGQKCVFIDQCSPSPQPKPHNVSFVNLVVSFDENDCKKEDDNNFNVNMFPSPKIKSVGGDTKLKVTTTMTDTGKVDIQPTYSHYHQGNSAMVCNLHYVLFGNSGCDVNFFLTNFTIFYCS